jgi:hypothetical protein
MRPARLVAALIAAILLPAADALGVTESLFTQAVFATARSAGKPILVAVTASGCPICVRQRSILSVLFTDPAFSRLDVYQIDFDSQKDAVRAMGATEQGTLIVYRGKAERGRSTGESDPGAIRALLTKAVE